MVLWFAERVRRGRLRGKPVLSVARTLETPDEIILNTMFTSTSQLFNLLACVLPIPKRSAGAPASVLTLATAFTRGAPRRGVCRGTRSGPRPGEILLPQMIPFSQATTCALPCPPCSCRRRCCNERCNPGIATPSASTPSFPIGERLATMIRDLVDAVRLESGQFQLARKPIEVPSFITGLCERLAGILPTERLRLSFEPRLPSLLADPSNGWNICWCTCSATRSSTRMRRPRSSCT